MCVGERRRKGVVQSVQIGSIRVHALATLHLTNHHDIHREGDVDESQKTKYDVANAFHSRLVLLWDAKGLPFHDFLPSEAGMHGEDQNAENVDDRPDWDLQSAQAFGVQESLKLHFVDVANFHRLDSGVICPEQLQLQDASKIDEVRRRTHQIIICGTKSELQQVHCHEHKKHQTSDGQIQLPRIEFLAVEANIPGIFQCHGYMQQSTQEDVLLDNVGWHAESSPIESDIKVAISIEVIWAFENVKVADSVNDDE